MVLPFDFSAAPALPLPDLSHLLERARGQMNARVHMRACTLGSGVTLTGTPRIDAAGTIDVGSRVHLNAEKAPIRLSARPGALLQIGDGTSVERGTEITASDAVYIGRGCRIGYDVRIADGSQDGPEATPAAPIRIEDHVRVSPRATICAGVTIGRGAVVAPGAVVTSNVLPHTLVAGVPARPVCDVRPV